MPEQVYRGVIDDTGEVVAVERVSSEYEGQAVNEFTVQMEVLPRLDHRNVVGYAGFCTDRGEGVLVFEYMPNGSLSDLLSGEYIGQRAWILSEAPETLVEVKCLK